MNKNLMNFCSLVEKHGFSGTNGYLPENEKNLNLKIQKTYNYKISLIVDVFGSGGTFGLDLKDKRHYE